MAPEPTPPLLVVCPHCRKPLANVAWIVNAEAGLITLFHNEEDCRVALNCQLVPVQRRVHLPSELRPMGNG
jgi:hypothetical protein